MSTDNIKGSRKIYMVMVDPKNESAFTQYVQSMNLRSTSAPLPSDDVVSDFPDFKPDSNLLTFLKGSDISDDVMKVIQMISMADVNKQVKSTPTAGSFKWKVQKYPGDIDMLEFYDVANDDREAALQTVCDIMVRIARDIDNDPNIILADLKCGYDTRFLGLLDMMGKTKADYANPDMIEYFEKEIPGFNRQGCLDQLAKLLQDGALDQGEYDKLVSLVPTVMTGDAYMNMFKVVRKSYLLRWTAADVMNRRLVIESKTDGGSSYIVNMEDAITHDTILKLDVWAKIGNRWTEVTNIYILNMIKSDGRKEPIGFAFKVSVDVATAIDIDYYSSPEHEKPYKLAKRIWNRAINKLAQNMDADGNLDHASADPTQMHIVKKIAPLFSADINILGQIGADLEIMIDGLDKRERLNLSYERFFKDNFAAIEAIPQKIFRVVNITPATENSIKQGVNAILDYVKSVAGTSHEHIYDELWRQKFDDATLETLKDMLEQLLKVMQKEQNAYAKAYLIENKLHPRVENSLVQINYSFNYLNLPPLSASSSDSTMGQIGGALRQYNQGNLASYYKHKYMKYKAKYTRR